MYCKALTHNFNLCCNHAKFDEFCGVHDPKKITCQGITQCGEKCKHIAKRGQFCLLHLIPVKPDHDYSELQLYNPDRGWPNISSVLQLTKKVKNGKELQKKFKHLERYNGIGFPHFENSPYKQNEHTMVLLEMFFVNYYLDYSTPHWQKIITDLHMKIENVNFLKEYRELFRKKFDKEYRTETQKKYNETVLGQSVLGHALSKKIVNLN